MANDDDTPRTFREVGIFLKLLKEDVEEIKTGQRKTKEMIFVALIAPIIVGLVVGYVLATSH